MAEPPKNSCVFIIFWVHLHIWSIYFHTHGVDEFPPSTKMIFNPGNPFLVRLHFRSYASYNINNNYIDDEFDSIAHLEILIRTRCKSGNLRLDEALGYFNTLIRTWPLPSIVAFNHLLGALPNKKNNCFTVLEVPTVVQLVLIWVASVCYWLFWSFWLFSFWIFCQILILISIHSKYQFNYSEKSFQFFFISQNIILISNLIISNIHI